MPNEIEAMTGELAMPMHSKLLLIRPGAAQRAYWSAHKAIDDSLAICHLPLVLSFTGSPPNR